ncbi:hypothetical protein Bhyg_08167 [Pseudolycoriella hygida]|uniref:Uncharacterized protein n=1 Tax=Pseudolycoriella hygida TaxID=35572 RepID=A0A9Q0S4J1_9DIPT|nr:hypothetical protein Bhyg_08167 [Pseudolycoriella hygida]
MLNHSLYSECVTRAYLNESKNELKYRIKAFITHNTSQIDHKNIYLHETQNCVVFMHIKYEKRNSTRTARKLTLNTKAFSLQYKCSAISQKHVDLYESRAFIVNFRCQPHQRSHFRHMLRGIIQTLLLLPGISY